MASFNREILVENIRCFHDASGLTQEVVANMIEISLPTYKKVLANQGAKSDETIFKILDFFGLTEEATKKKILVPKFYRKTLEDKYKGNVKYKKGLEDPPFLPFALEYFLLPAGKLKKPVKIGGIKDYLDSLGWEFTASEISDAIRRNKARLGIKTRKIAGSEKGYEYFI